MRKGFLQFEPAPRRGEPEVGCCVLLAGFSLYTSQAHLCPACNMTTAVEVEGALRAVCLFFLSRFYSVLSLCMTTCLQVSIALVCSPRCLAACRSRGGRLIISCEAGIGFSSVAPSSISSWRRYEGSCVFDRQQGATIKLLVTFDRKNSVRVYGPFSH
jgi:hypothetical protein